MDIEHNVQLAEFGVAMTAQDNALLAHSRSKLEMPSEFGRCELVDKAGAFVCAAAKRASDPRSYESYLHEEGEKFIGIGEGLRIATCQTVAAFTDGTVLHFLENPKETIEPLVATINGTVKKAAANPKEFLAGEALAIAQASKHYSASSDREKGRVIGETMFAMASGEAAEGVCVKVDQVVVEGVKASLKATEDLRKTAPELAARSKEMLFDYTRRLKLSHEELALAGVPRGYFSPGAQRDDVLAMASFDERPDLPKEAFRADDDFYSRVNPWGQAKAYINEEGDMVPADVKGLYEDKEVTIAEHVLGDAETGAKSHSPYISFSPRDGGVVFYGKTKVKLDLAGLREAISSGEVKGVQIFEHEEVLRAIEQSSLEASRKQVALALARAEREILIKGIVPERFLDVQ